MPTFNSAYFQAQILKTQITSNVFTADVERVNSSDGAATIDVSMNVFLYINAQSGSTTPTASADNSGNYFINTASSATLYRSNSATWATVNSNRVIFNPTSNASYANKAYTTSGGGVLTQYTSATYKLKTNTLQLFSVASTTPYTVSAVSSGRYFVQDASGLPTNIDATDLLDVGLDVTDGTYTTVLETRGSRQLTTTSGYLYSNGIIWQIYNAT